LYIYKDWKVVGGDFEKGPFLGMRAYGLRDWGEWYATKSLKNR